MKNRIVCKSLVAGMISFSLLLGQVVPAFGAVQDKESVRKYYHYQDALSEAKKRVVKVAKKDATYDKSSSDTVEEHTDEYGAVTKDTYDEAGNLISRNVNGKDVIQFSYNSAGNITSIKDALGFETKYEYDESNRLMMVKIYPKLYCRIIVKQAISTTNRVELLLKQKLTVLLQIYNMMKPEIS